MRVLFAGILAAGLLSGSAFAGNLKYQPVNPNFGGSPLNGSVLLNEANAQNKYEAKQNAASSLANRTPAERFAETFQARLLSSVSDNITDAIFGKDARDSGTFQVDGTTIQFQRVGNNVNLTINDGINTTTVVVPVAF